MECGEHRTLLQGEFDSYLTLDEIKAKYDKYKKKVLSENTHMSKRDLDYYEFEITDIPANLLGITRYQVVHKEDGYEPPDETVLILAIFLSKIVAYETCIEYADKDYGNWGYYIFRGAVRQMQYTQYPGALVYESTSKEKRWI